MPFVKGQVQKKMAGLNKAVFPSRFKGKEELFYKEFTRVFE